jgi:signal peptidase I
MPFQFEEVVATGSMNTQTQEECKCSLAEEVLRSWGRLRLQVCGLSMLPTLWPGDLLTIRAHAFDQAQPGDIVLYMREGRLFVHRIVRRRGSGPEAFLITRGDCMPKNDPPIRGADLLGRVTLVRHCGSLIVPARKLSTLRLIYAVLLCRWNSFQRVALYWHARRKAELDLQFSLDGVRA